LSVVNSKAILKLYEIIYCHPLNNGQYSVVFLKGWLAQHKGEKVNWTYYAYDCMQLQMKKATRATSGPKSSHHSLKDSKSTNLLTNSNYNTKSNNVEDDDSMLLIGNKTTTIVFLPRQVSIG
jgi:hypothetical protein